VDKLTKWAKIERCEKSENVKKTKQVIEHLYQEAI